MTTEAVREEDCAGGELTRTRWAPVVALGLGMLVVTSEMTISAVALPSIGADLGASPATTAWVLLAYSLPMAAIAIPAGRWADRAGVRAAFLASMAGVGVASVLSALAPTMPLLLATRVLQGLAGGLIVCVYMPLITCSVRENQRGSAIGYIIMIMTLGGVAGAPIGGLVASELGWRAVFLIKLPLLVAVLWLGARTVPTGSGRGLPVPDRSLVREAALLGGAVTGLLVAFDKFVTQPVLAAGLAALGIGLAVGWSRLASARPMVALVRRPAFGGTLVTLFTMSLSAGLLFFLLPYFIADVLHGSPETTGLALLCYIGAIAPISPLAGLLTDRFGPRPVIATGAALSVAGMLSMLSLDTGASLVDLSWRLALFGAGAGLFNTAVNTATLGAAPPGMAGSAGGASMTARSVAMTMGSSVAALGWTLAGGGSLGFRVGILGLATLAVAGILAYLALTRRPLDA